MFLSVVSALVIIGSSSGPGDLSERELRAWKKIEPAIVYLMEGKSVRGTATLIDRDGYFLAHRTAMDGTKTVAKNANGQTVDLNLVSTDEPTQFILLKADNWSASNAVPVSLSESEAGDKSLLAITNRGPIRAERAGSTYGIVNPSRRMMPLSEIRLENTQSSLGGALLFNIEGQLVGALNATLETPETTQNFRLRNSAAMVDPITAKSNNNKQAVQIFGPGVMTTAYTITPKVMRRVVAGFCSSERQVQHPTIGIFCVDAVPQGALIQIVSEGSSAEKAGLKKGDIITSMNNQAVRNQLDFARIMLDEEVGSTLRMWIKRDGLQQMIQVQIGK